MIPDDSVAGVMDAATDPDVGLEDAGRKKTEDINDNHTKLKESEEDDDGEDDSASLTNGEVAEGQSERESDVNEERVQEEVEEEGAGQEASEEEKESSEDDEDKLVISEGVEKQQDDSADDNSKGEATVVASSKAPSPASPPDSPRRSEKRPAEGEGEGEAALDSPSKRPRPLEDLVSLDTLTSLPQVEGSLAQIKRDLEAVEFLVKQKEEEWNTLLRLQKRKEELYVRLARRRQTLLMRQEEGGGAGSDQGDEGRSSSSSNLLFLPQGGYSSLSGPQLPLMMMSQLLGSSASAQALQMVGGPAVVRAREGSPNTDTTTTNNGNISVIDIHTSTNKAPGDRSKLPHEAPGKLTRHISSAMKPILPKPPGAGMGALPTSLSFSATGQGPQGPTVNVQHLIAAHRKENPNTPPISSKHLTARRATRGAWRNRYDGDKRPTPPHRDQDRPPSVSSSSSDAESRTAGTPAGLPPSSKSLLTLNDPSVSYKDVLLRFAELTQIEKQPGSPQISIFPVASNEGPGKRSDLSRESTPGMRAHTPPTHLPPTASSTAAAPTPKSGLEAPSALAKLLLESRGGVSSSGLVKGVGGSGGEATPNSHYLTLSALLSGGSTTTVKDKLTHAQQSEGRSKKAATTTTTTSNSGTSSQPGEEGSGNPKCQGCHKQRAQFVCAGCGNQWYCSRECQVSSWEEHSEHCSN